MVLSNITKEAVLRAVEEYRSIKQEAFLEKYGFKTSTCYLLMIDGEEFDSNAIVGAAHGYALPESGPLKSDEFSGGKNTTVRLLENMGFQIVEKVAPSKRIWNIDNLRNPLWTRDELILATEFFKKYAPQIPGKTDKRLINLSDEIRSLASSLGLHGNDTFRNPNSVSMKLMELIKYDPNSTGKGLGRKPRAVEQEVWDLEAIELEAASQFIRDAMKSIKNGAIPWEVATDAVEPEVAEAAEGTLVTRLHRYRERNTKIVKNKKKQFLKKHGRLFCDVCAFDYVAKYGDRGAGYIECHHTVPVSEMKPGDKTKLSDLALVCANCHRMIHAKRPWLSIEDLARLLRNPK